MISGQKAHNQSKNYSINSRINNPRPINNLAKNLLSSSNIINDEGREYDNISMSSFDDKPSIPSTTKNDPRGTKKIKFDEIMKGITLDRPNESPPKTRAQKMIKDNFQTSKTFMQSSRYNMVKKAPMTMKNQHKITTISFNTNLKTTLFEDKSRSAIKKKPDNTTTGVQSPKITVERNKAV